MNKTEISAGVTRLRKNYLAERFFHDEPYLTVPTIHERDPRYKDKVRQLLFSGLHIFFRFSDNIERPISIPILRYSKDNAHLSVSPHPLSINLEIEPCDIPDSKIAFTLTHDKIIKGDGEVATYGEIVTLEKLLKLLSTPERERLL